MRAGRLTLLWAMPLVVATSVAQAANEEGERGHALAQAWCVQCHAVDATDLRASARDSLSFAAIASLGTSTSPALHAFLATPHPDMPSVKLTSSEVDDLIAYILSLKRQ
jgi:mono/diheme cytochrome c family protein